jgi:hypothetical protein
VSSGRVLLATVAVALVAVAPAAADGWLPHPADATWEYVWTDSAYSTTPTKEKVTVKTQKSASFTLAWTTENEGNPLESFPSVGTISFEETNLGLLNTDWSSNAPPASFPILCTSVSNCGNSLASTYYNVIWGTRSPVLPEPLLQGVSWSATGGAANDVSSANDYVGTEMVTVPAFPKPVLAAKVRSQITQAGALGDPYGSGTRTTWWVYGVGPVKVVFQHAGGSHAPVTTAELQSTNQTPAAPPPDPSYFPMKVAGAYQLTTRLDGVTSVASATNAASLTKLPPHGPRSLPANKRRHFFTPFDLMTYGFNPVLPAYPKIGATWSSDPRSRDFGVYGVNGTSKVIGVQKVTVPAGTYQALVVTSSLRQPGFPFGSGTRTMWFAPDKGLVRLQFRHGDGSISVVELTK